ncbi:MAG TPA: alpha-hydroxy-acid oxidizing protein [Solirubrobacterales bacterium]|jgi:isopentenyl diphosphate isomerase/L-lactate dehydrogenase-like FMN-dependent dehydrogenase|nr:alpha-hydroxy-acid oxidizing protein [Solirubrobacterales bacterium]
MPDPADYYREIYARGLAGEVPAVPVAVAELERRAVEAMEPKAANYVGAGAGAEETIRANLEAFRRRRIVPRMLRDVASRDLSTSVLGTAMPAPLMLAPIGVQKVLHPEGELATARAAAALGVPMIASTASHFTLEEIAEAGGEGAPRWFQLYWPGDPELLRSFVGRAERAGYGAIVVTVDAFIPGWKPRDLQQAWLPFLEGSGNANYLQDPVFRCGLQRTPEEDLGAATGQYLSVLSNPSLTWEELASLRELTRLPILVKGIQHVEDARKAARRGIDGIVVSNHGGRQVDGAIASLDALPAIAEAVRGELAILFDSGVRGGADVLKALALGADAVCLGRPYLWGLALDGQAGVEAVLKMVLGELDLTMALCGLTRPAEITAELLAS